MLIQDKIDRCMDIIYLIKIIKFNSSIKIFKKEKISLSFKLKKPFLYNIKLFKLKVPEEISLA